jgi:hypothetical protein
LPEGQVAEAGCGGLGPVEQPSAVQCHVTTHVAAKGTEVQGLKVRPFGGHHDCVGTARDVVGGLVLPPYCAAVKAALIDQIRVSH